MPKFRANTPTTMSASMLALIMIFPFTDVKAYHNGEEFLARHTSTERTSPFGKGDDNAAPSATATPAIMYRKVQPVEINAAGLLNVQFHPPAATATRQIDKASSINQMDMIALLDPNLPNKQQTWSGLNCFGQYPSISNLAAVGLVDVTKPSPEATRFGRVADPLDPSQVSFLFNVSEGDPLTAGAKRCEALAPPTAATALPRGQPFWYAFRLLLWHGAEAQTGRALLTQWHVHGFNPFLGLVIKQGHLLFTARYNPYSKTIQPKPTTVELWRDSAPVQRQWMSFVIQANISPIADDRPYVKVWRDGQQIVDYSGPLGYNDSGLAYAKIGYYHWLNDNPWDTTVPQRSVYVSKAVLIRDERNRYTEAQIRQKINE